jgi:hypothetical protein
VRRCPATPREFDGLLDFLEPVDPGRHAPIAGMVFEQVSTCPRCDEPVRRCDPRRLVDNRLFHLTCVGDAAHGGGRDGGREVSGGEQLTLFHAPAVGELGEAWHRHCHDCDADTWRIGEYYMVHADIWPLDADGGALCVGCLETRLGRRLVAADFSPAPVNDPDPWSRHSRRLADRLGVSGG